MAHYENFMFMGGWRDTLEGMKVSFGEDYAKDVLWNIMTVATAGDTTTEDPFTLQYIRGSVMPAIDSAKGKYAGYTDNGKKGGAKSKEIDMYEIERMREEDLSWSYIASYISSTCTKISSEGLRKKYLKWKENNNNDNQPTTTLTTSCQKVVKKDNLEDKKKALGF